MLRDKVLADRYEVIEPIARGGMAEVFRARDNLLNRTVAVKVLHPEFASDPAFVERFKREAQAAANLSHPNIVAVYDWGQDDTTYYIVMEYVDGRSLRDILRADGRIAPRRAVEITAEIAAALQFAHRRRVVHRDIKPGNILINRTGEVKVTDFGIARAIGAAEGLTQTGAVIGTAAYLSPEQAQGLAVDAKSDVYSLGVVLFEMLTGRVPFAGDTPISIALKHVNEDPVSPRELGAEIPQSLELVVLKALAKNPSRRYASAEEMRQDLVRVERGEQVIATPLTAEQVEAEAAERPPDESVVERKPRSWPFWIVLLLLLALLGVGLYLLGKSLGVFSPPAEVALPGVVGQTYDPGAKQTLEKLGLIPEPTYQQSSTADAGKVLSQSPAEGVNVRVNSKVQIVVGQGPGTARTPKVIGISKDEATKLITAAGFVLGNVKEEYSDSIEAGIVIDQDPVAEKDVVKGSPINLVVSSGKEKVKVPDVGGKDQNDAIRTIQSAGLQVGNITQQQNNAPPNTIISQNPKAGTEVDKGSSVSIVVSTGPKQVVVPGLVNMARSAAISALAKESLKANVVTCTPASPGQEGKVVAQDPPSGTEVEKGSTVKITVGDTTAGGAVCPSG